MKRSHYLMAPVIALGLSTGCTGKDSKIKLKPDAHPAVVDVKVVPPDAECPHGAMVFSLASQKANKQCLPAPAAEGEPTGPSWVADLHVDSEHAPDVAHAALVSKVAGNVHYDLKGVETVYMPHLTEVGGDLVVGSKAADSAAQNGILNLSGLARLRSVGGTLYIQGNAKLVDLSGLAALETVGQIVVENNEALQAFNLPPKVKQVNAMEVARNPALTQISGDNALTRIIDALTLSGNPKLADLGAFNKVQEAKSLTVTDNAQLPNLGGFAGLVKVTESLEVGENAALQNLDGLAALQEVGIHLEVRGNAALGGEKGTVVGLPALRKVHALRFIDNPVMQSLSGFPQLVEANDLVVHGNKNLAQIDAPALHNVERVQIGKTAVGRDSQDPTGNTEGTMTQQLITHYEYQLTHPPKA